MGLETQRREYSSAELRRAGLAENPLQQFGNWLDHALELELKDATAMALATAAPDAVPSVRIVLLKGCDERGFSFFSDFRSQKGRELAENPVAALLFHWRELDRQVRVTGSVVRLPESEARDYFVARPEPSRLAASASTQSAPIADRAALEAAVLAQQQRYPDGQVPMPQQWGGYLLAPESYEFWQGREGRLHDRFRYLRRSDGWRVERLQP